MCRGDMLDEFKDGRMTWPFSSGVRAIPVTNMKCSARLPAKCLPISPLESKERAGQSETPAFLWTYQCP